MIAFFNPFSGINIILYFAPRLLRRTREPQGAVIVSVDAVNELGGSEDVADTVGAGDAFTATMTLGLLAGHSVEKVNRDAIAVAAFGCSQPGATMPFPNQLRLGEHDHA